MPIMGTCEICGGETSDYECLGCMRARIAELEAIDATVALDVGLGGCVLYHSYQVFDRNGHAVSVSDSYSTTEAAEVAEREAV